MVVVVVSNCGDNHSTGMSRKSVATAALEAQRPDDDEPSGESLGSEDTDDGEAADEEYQDLLKQVQALPEFEHFYQMCLKFVSKYGGNLPPFRDLDKELWAAFFHHALYSNMPDDH